MLPILGIGLLEVLSDTVLDPVVPFPWDTMIVMGVIAVFALLTASVAFRSIDRLTLALQERNRELEARNASARALHRVSVALTALGNLAAILQAIVDNGRALLDADVALLVLTRPDGTLQLAARSGPAAAFDASGGLEGTDFRRFVQPDRLRSHLAAPLQRGGRTIGTLAVGSSNGRGYAVDAVETLASLASQAAIALENDRLQGELRELAIRGERERIAREMHDGLAQVLGYVNTKSQAVEELLASGRVDLARVQLAELSTAARSVYVDVREAILGLTSPIAPERGLVGALEEFATRFSDASKIAVSVDASQEAQDLRLAPAIQAQIFRIVQEALTNVRKHAAAGRAGITLDVVDDCLEVCVEDDGRGFDPNAPRGEGWPHIGVRAMRERAESLGGSVAFVGGSGGGARVEVRVPLAAALEIA